MMNNAELVRRVAEEVMGCLIGWRGYGHDVLFKYKGQKWRLNEHPADPRYSPPLFDPIDNANHIMMVVERMRELGFYSVIHNDTDGSSPYRAEFYCVRPENRRFMGYGKLGIAVCEAALKAVEGGNAK